MKHTVLKAIHIKKVLDTSMKLFSENGIENTSIMEISRNAMIAERSIYRYFGSKDRLVVALLKFNTEELKTKITKLTDTKEFEEKVPIDQILYIAKLLLHFSKKHAKRQICLTDLEHYLYRHNLSYLKIFYDSRNNVLIMLFKWIFKKGIKDGSISRKFMDNNDLFITLAVTFRGFMNRISLLSSNSIINEKYNCDELIKIFVEDIRDYIVKP